jgi:hypothetical protein
VRALLIITTAALIAGCSTTKTLPPPEREVVKDVRYIVALPPPELLKLPPQPPAIKDLDKAKQSDVASWLTASEERVARLEQQLKEIAKFLLEAQESADKKAREESDK